MAVAPRPERITYASELIRANSTLGRKKINEALRIQFGTGGGLHKDDVDRLKHTILKTKPSRGYSQTYVVRDSEGKPAHYRTYQNKATPSLGDRAGWYWARTGKSKIIPDHVYRHFQRHYGFVQLTMPNVRRATADLEDELNSLKRKFSLRHTFIVQVTVIPRAKTRGEAMSMYKKNAEANSRTLTMNARVFSLLKASVLQFFDKLKHFPDHDYPAWLVINKVMVYTP